MEKEKINPYQSLPAILKLYNSLPGKLIPVKRLVQGVKKQPAQSGWNQSSVPQLSDEELTNHFHRYGALGFKPGPELLIIDVDNKPGKSDKIKTGFESLKSLSDDICSEYNLPKNDSYFKPSVITPSGGFHIYMNIPKQLQGQKIKFRLPGYTNIDFITEMRYVVIPPSIVHGPNGEKLKYRFYNE